jgi:DeoR/GlpR family transcriptional regulator of sugar metabolism
MIAPGQAVIFDSGTTVSQVAVHVPASLRRGTTLTVVTNSLPVIDEVAAWDGPALMVLGGLYLPDHQALVGPQTVADLRAISADLLFVGCDGLTLETGLTTPNVLVAEVAATMVARAERVVVVADGSKLGRRGFRPFAALSAVDVLVTNTEADPAQVQVARDAGIEVVLV